ncbi:hypothetical protein D3C81_1750220 [compost metagenome]
MAKVAAAAFGSWMMSRMPCRVAWTTPPTTCGWLLMASSEARIAWAMLSKIWFCGIRLISTPASSALTTQSGTPAMAWALLAENSCHTPDGPAAWMSTSVLLRPALRSEASRA